LKTIARLLMVSMLVMPAIAQRGGSGRGGGFGRGGFHGGYGHGFGGGFRSGGFGHAGPRFGFGGYGGFHYGSRYAFPRQFYGGGLGFFPYSYPIYSYPSYNYPYYSAYSYPPQAPNIVIYPTETVPPPLSVYEPPPLLRPEIREYREYRDIPPPSEKYEPLIYLIALKNQDNIRAAEAYWMEGETLHYVTLQHAHKQAPLDSIDRALSTKLNRQRRVDFRLPPE
jgi:hypothetical protein